MRRITVLALGALLALLALGGAALAKEGAVTKFDSLPSEWHAGQNYTLGYMIRMDGVEPYKADTTEIVIRNGTGKVLSYPGTPDGTPGHYTAKVYFPAAGSYTWLRADGPRHDHRARTGQRLDERSPRIRPLERSARHGGPDRGGAHRHRRGPASRATRPHAAPRGHRVARSSESGEPALPALTFCPCAETARSARPLRPHPRWAR